ncbi:MAG: NAD-dependent epimerase/dehydratase family protein [Deltaproteobacteria bacterium]|nr:MAG: NAD-dependent epimerase/dehydratase family protein [Deltaproteobacteria bacterium]
MSYRILITGSEGLVGTALRRLLEARGLHVVGLDLLARNAEEGDVRDAERVRTAVAGCDGIVHLAAVSRVVWAERDPETCWSTNVGGLHNVVDAAMDRACPPWLVFASSREVYGQPESLPVTEDAPLRPVNVYGRSKVEGERIVGVARRNGLRAAIVRLSNVYGSTSDHADRVVPAFARAAARGDALRVEGAEHTFDFTHIDDTARGILALIEILVAGESVPPPIHLLTGQPTTLGQLAEMAVRLAGARSTVEQAPPRSFDVSHFYGSPARARALLDWTPRTAIHEGLGRLIEDFQVELGAREHTGVAL